MPHCIMQNPCLDHPAEEELERFLLRQSHEEELEQVETHILACETCVARLEALETQIAVMKVALAQSQAERATAPAEGEHSWRNRFTIPRLAWAGGAAVLALGIALIPQFSRVPVPADVNLSAYRGSQVAMVPANRPLHIRLNTSDLAEGPVSVEIVDNLGAAIWKGSATVQYDRADITLPGGIRNTGAHFLRLYLPSRGRTNGDLLREFAFVVQ